MALVSTKLVQEIGAAIANSQSEHRVALGNEQLRCLRERYDYELGLSAFISQAKDLNDRLFALLELRLMAQITEEHTIFTLKGLYYEDVDKVAAIIAKLISHPVNKKISGLFFEVNFQTLGYLGCIRYIQLLFTCLKKQEPFENNVEDTLLRLLELAETVMESQISLRMLTISLALFYQNILEYTRDKYLDMLVEHWREFDQKSKFDETPFVAVLKQVIDDFLAGKKSNLPPAMLADMVAFAFNSLRTNNTHQLRYQAQELRFICANCNIFHCDDSLFEFVNVVHRQMQNKNRAILQGAQYGQVNSLLGFSGEEESSKSQKQINAIIYTLVEQIFEHHYVLLSQRYSQYRGKPFFIFMVPLSIFHEDSLNSSTICRWITDHIPLVVDQIGLFLERLKFENRKNQEEAIDFLGFLQFLIRFKNMIDIEMLPHICGLMQDVSKHEATLSPFCYCFVEDVWEQLSVLDGYKLQTFLVRHLRSLNENEWDHQLSNYSCFLHLTEHIEETYQILSSLMSDNELFQESLRAHKNIIQILYEGKGEMKQGEFSLLSLLISLTVSLMGGRDKGYSMEDYRRLGIQFLHNLIVKFNMDDQDSQTVERFYKWGQTQSIVENNFDCFK